MPEEAVAAVAVGEADEHIEVLDVQRPSLLDVVMQKAEVSRPPACMPPSQACHHPPPLALPPALTRSPPPHQQKEASYGAGKPHICSHQISSPHLT